MTKIELIRPSLGKQQLFLLRKQESCTELNIVVRTLVRLDHVAIRRCPQIDRLLAPVNDPADAAPDRHGPLFSNGKLMSVEIGF